jgi:hypothetical protein
MDEHETGAPAPNEDSEGSVIEPTPVEPAADQAAGGWGTFEPSPEAERHASWMGQLQAMIDNVARQSGPTLKEIAAKAAELAAKAGDAAGPVAHRAAEVTGDVGQKVAVRGRELATELRRSTGGGGTGTAVAEAPTEAPAAESTEPVATDDPNGSDGSAGAGA